MWSVPSSMRCCTRLARIRTWRSEGEADELRDPFVGSSLVVHPVHSNSTVTPTAVAGLTRSRERLAEETERGEPRGGILTDPTRPDQVRSAVITTLPLTSVIVRSVAAGRSSAALRLHFTASPPVPRNVPAVVRTPSVSVNQAR